MDMDEVILAVELRWFERGVREGGNLHQDGVCVKQDNLKIMRQPTGN